MAHARGESETHDFNDDETSDCTVEPERDSGSCGALWYRLDAASGRRARHAGTASRLPKRRYAIVRAVCPGRPADHDLHGPDAALRQSSLSRNHGASEAAARWPLRSERPRPRTSRLHDPASLSLGSLEVAAVTAPEGGRKGLPRGWRRRRRGCKAPTPCNAALAKPCWRASATLQTLPAVGGGGVTGSAPAARSRSPAKAMVRRSHCLERGYSIGLFDAWIVGHQYFGTDFLRRALTRC
jgi:hypothetical protein